MLGADLQNGLDKMKTIVEAQPSPTIVAQAETMSNDTTSQIQVTTTQH